MANDPKPTWQQQPLTQATLDVPGREPAPPPSGGLPLPERYTDLGQLGRGGNGEVRRVHDRVLQRDLAMKLLVPSQEWSADRMARLRAEAVITAQLQHPGIVPVHDLGALDDGRVWFTMKEVRGVTLARAIAGEPRAWPLRGLLARFEQVCQAVAFAHSRGVVHRDLKPGNIMLGEFGEVLVVDWGLAVSVDPSGARRGAVAGTPVYMAPEQARGAAGAEAPPVDCYALGAVLYEILSGRPPYRASGRAAIRAVLDGPPRPLRPSDRVPDALAALCASAMARAPGGRPSATEIAQGIADWRDGEQRREQALGAVAQADALRPRIEARQAQAEALRREAEALLATIRPADPIADKEPAWDLQDAAAEEGRQAQLDETIWLQTLRSALNLAPELPEAHDRLADHYRRQLEAAEARRDADAVASSAWLLRQHDRGQHAAYLDGTGRLSLSTDPPGATVHLQRYVERRKRLVAVDAGTIGTTPLVEHPLAPGSYRLVLRHPARAEVFYPVLIERRGHWDGGAPVYLPRQADLGPDEVYVPAGRFIAGGDPDAGDALPRQRVWVDGFVIKRSPVTVEEYLAFLNELVAQGRTEEAERAQPLAGFSTAAPHAAVRVFPRGADGQFGTGCDDQGVTWDADWPVTQIDWHGAQAFAAWRQARDGRAWRLPNELEREKAARGVDGRFFPWGDDFDPSFARVASSVRGPPRPASPQDFAVDTSAYGVRGLAGNTRDWCGNVWTRGGPIAASTGRMLHPAPPLDSDGVFVAVRGGSFAGKATSSRAAARFGAPATARLMNLGIRLARPMDALSLASWRT